MAPHNNIITQLPLAFKTKKWREGEREAREIREGREKGRGEGREGEREAREVSEGWEKSQS